MKDSIFFAEKKSDLFVIDFIKEFIRKWNNRAPFSPRAIIISHAGSGYAKKTIPSPLLGGVREHVVYDTSIHALLKTLVFSRYLRVFLNEADPVRYKELQDLVDDVTTRGLRVFVKNTHKQKTLNLVTSRYNRVKERESKLFPEGPQDACPAGYHESYIITKATIKCYPTEISASITKIIKELLPKKTKSKKASKPKPAPLSLFVIEPRGTVDLKVLDDICAYHGEHGGAELILGFPPGCSLAVDQAGGVAQKLRGTWTHVVETGSEAKDNGMRLVVCTDHKASAVLAGYNTEIKNAAPRNDKFKDLLDFTLEH